MVVMIAMVVVMVAANIDAARTNDDRPVVVMMMVMVAVMMVMILGDLDVRTGLTDRLGARRGRIGRPQQRERVRDRLEQLGE